VRARTRARGWALQTLYAWESRGAEVPVVQILREFAEERNIAAESREYLQQLVSAVGKNQAEIDAALTHSLTNWRLDRLSVVDRNILRLAAAEMLYIEEIPPRVSIQEALTLAEKYGTAESPRFVNGVLDALMRQIQKS
jgi:N utilization substance protein B